RLALVSDRPLQQGPHVAVWVSEIRVEDTAHVVDVTRIDATLGQCSPGRGHVLDNEMKALDRTRNHVRDWAHPRTEDDRAARPRWSELHDSHRVRNLSVMQISEPHLLVESLCSVNI